MHHTTHSWLDCMFNVSIIYFKISFSYLLFVGRRTNRNIFFLFDLISMSNGNMARDEHFKRILVSMEIERSLSGGAAVTGSAASTTNKIATEKGIVMWVNFFFSHFFQIEQEKNREFFFIFHRIEDGNEGFRRGGVRMKFYISNALASKKKRKEIIAYCEVKILSTATISIHTAAAAGTTNTCGNCWHPKSMDTHRRHQYGCGCDRIYRLGLDTWNRFSFNECIMPFMKAFWFACFMENRRQSSCTRIHYAYGS